MRITRKGEDTIRLLVYISAILTLGIVFWILGHILVNGIIKLNWNEVLKDTGICPSIINTFFIVVLSILISAPLGIGAAIYLNEYAQEGDWFILSDILYKA